MATLQKFKLLATQCAVMSSPTRSPISSPVIHLRRRKTLRMLLTRGASSRRLKESSVDIPPKKLTASNKLKDLFISSSSSPTITDPIPDQKISTRPVVNPERGKIPAAAAGNGTLIAGDAGNKAVASFSHTPPRPLSATFRQRLLRRAFRPVLVAIPE